MWLGILFAHHGKDLITDMQPDMLGPLLKGICWGLETGFQMKKKCIFVVPYTDLWGCLLLPSNLVYADRYKYVGNIVSDNMRQNSKISWE